MSIRRAAVWALILLAHQLGGLACYEARAQGTVAVQPSIRAIAIVIGMARYSELPELPNSGNDAKRIAQTLEDLGFDVVKVLDATRAEASQALETFYKMIEGAEVVFFYYAGHGIQHQGTNFLVPVDVRLSDRIDPSSALISLGAVLEAIDAINGEAAKIVILDACRDNPLVDRLAAQGVSRGITRQVGLARISLARSIGPQTDTSSSGYFRIVAFATAAGSVASDGEGENSPYTRSLLKFLREPGLEVGNMFRMVAADVLAETKGIQRPEYLVQTSRSLFFRPMEISECDRVAIEAGNFVGLGGIPFDELDAPRAVAACEAALKRNPDSARLMHNTARAYEKAERLAEAVALYEASAERGYRAAINSLGVMYLAGCGLAKPDPVKGIALIAKAKALGHPSARAALTGHDLWDYVERRGIERLAAALSARGHLKKLTARKVTPELRIALQRFQKQENLVQAGLTLESIHALGLADIVPKGFRCH